MRFIRTWPQAWQAKQARCQQRRSPARAANTPYSPGLSRSLHCRRGCWADQRRHHPPSFPPGSSTPTPTQLFSPYPWQSHLYYRLHQEPLDLVSLFLQVCQTVNPQTLSPTRVPEASPFCRSERTKSRGRGILRPGTTYLLTGAFFQLGRYQAGHPLSQGLPPPLGTEEPQLRQLLLPKGQAVALLQKQASTVTGRSPAGKTED